MAIRPDTDSMSAAPRSGAPKGELEQYGVWVKAEPQDILEEVNLPDVEDLNFDIPTESSSESDEPFLSAEEESLLGSFEADDTSQGVETSPMPTLDDMPPLEESLLDVEEASFGEGIPDFANEPLVSSQDDFSIDSLPTFSPGAEIDMNEIQGLDKPVESADVAPGTIEDVSSEFLEGLDVSEAKSEPKGQSASGFGLEMDDVTAEFLDIEPAAASAKPSSPSGEEGGSDFEALDIDLDFEEPTAAKASTAPDFDDISAVEQELSAPIPDRSAAPEPQKTDLATEILLKIANELSSIRGELVSLKTQIGEMKVKVETAQPLVQSEAEIEASPLEQTQAQQKSGGFFDDEEDETIALTGDELDNILNTADFTTEEASDAESLGEQGAEALAAEELAIDTLPDVDALLGDSLLPESGDYSSIEPGTPVEEQEAETLEMEPLEAELLATESAPSADLESFDDILGEPAIEEIRLGVADSFAEIAPEDPNSAMPANEGLEDVVVKGVTPVTPAPEDTSYLESPETLDLGAALGNNAFAEESLEEPDLSEFELGQGALDISEELPLASSDSDKSIEDIGDLTLDIPAGPEYASSREEALAEETIEVLPEIEETDFADLNFEEDTKDDSLPAKDETDLLSDIDFLSSDLLPKEEEIQEAPVEEEDDLILASEEIAPPPAPRPAPVPAPAASPSPAKRQEHELGADENDRLKSEIKSVLSYLDKLLDALPEDKIEEFARSKYFETYKKLFEELGLV
jgi:pilus assembly protein FimV